MLTEETFDKFVASLTVSSTDGLSADSIEKYWLFIRKAFKAQLALEEAYFKIHQTQCRFCEKQPQGCSDCDAMRVIKMIEDAQN